MKRNLRRAVASVIASFMLFMSLTACAQKDTTDKPSKDAVQEESENEISLAGIGIKLISGFTADTFLGYKLGSSLADELIARIDRVSAEMDFTADVVTAADPVSDIKSGELAGVAAADIVYSPSYPLRQLGNASMLTDIAEVDDIIDYTDSHRWGTKNSLELLTCKGVLIGVQTASWIDNLPPYYFAVVTNNGILAENGYTSPHEYDEQKKWTRETFSEMVFNCSDTGRGLYGFETNEEYIYIMSVLSNGLHVIMEDADGSCHSVWEEPLAIESLEWAHDFIATDRSAFAFTGQSYVNFTAGNSALCMCDAGLTTRQLAFADSVKSFSVIRFPCLDSQPYGTCGGLYSTNLFGVSIPLSVDEKENSAYVIDRVFAPMDSYPTAQSVRDYYTSDIFFDSRDTDQLFMLCDSASYDYWVEGCWSGCETVIGSVMKGKTPAEAIEKNLEAINKTIQAEVVPNRAGLNSYFTD